MGIKSLTYLIKEKSPDAIQSVSLYTLKDKRVAIDTSIFLYKSFCNFLTLHMKLFRLQVKI